MTSGAQDRMRNLSLKANTLTGKGARIINPAGPATVLESVAGAALATRQLALWLVPAFGLTALLLAVVGIYGVMAQTVSQRTHEFGVRQALGATRADIMRLVFSSSALMTVAGLLTGVGRRSW